MKNRFFQFLGLTKKAGHLLEGYNRCEDAMGRKKMVLIIISKECSENTQKKFKRYCEQNNIPFIEGCSNEELGSALGKPEVNILGVTNGDMGKRLLQLWQENN